MRLSAMGLTFQGVAGHRKRRKPVRRQELDGHAELGGSASERVQCPHHAVDLGTPSVGRDEDAHQAAFGRAAARMLLIRMRQQLPFHVSAM
jgi:hypothetical protein